MLLGNVAAQEVIAFSKDAKLWVLPAGSKTNNPADLLNSNRMKSLMEHCRQAFDYIVIDSPPIGPVIDPIVLSHLADSVVYVVRWASTARELIQQSIKRLPENKVAGVVFNLLNEKGGPEIREIRLSVLLRLAQLQEILRRMSSRRLLFAR